MIDEEMAEEYIKKNNLEWELECNRTISIGEVKQAYLAGLKAGRLKWHDLRKNPEDLPPRKGLETYSERLITDKGYSVYNFRKCRWYVDEPDCDCMVHRDVIAWCEIPKFEE